MDPTVHFEVIKSELTRQVFSVTPEVCDELKGAVDEIWGFEPDEDDEDRPTEKRGWKTVALFDSMTQIVARMSNRVFVGLPLCEYPLFFGRGPEEVMQWLATQGSTWSTDLSKGISRSDAEPRC